MQLPYTKNCFVCGAQNPHGLRLRFRREGAEVRSDFIPSIAQAGYREIVHGGIISTVLDEALFWAAATAMRRFCLAVELNVRFSRKVSVGETYLIVARFSADRGRVWESSGELLEASGAVCARAICKQMPMDAATMNHVAVDFLPDPATVPVNELFPDLVV